MELTKIYIALNSVFLLTSSWSLMTDNTRNVYIYQSDLLIGILGFIFGVILVFSTIGLFLEKKMAYRITLTTYKTMFITSSIYVVIVIISRPSIVLDDWMESIFVLGIFLINIIVMYKLHKKIKQF